MLDVHLKTTSDPVVQRNSVQGTGFGLNNESGPEVDVTADY